ncbi:MAG TPA: tRNA (N6-threonylcarbamoyladenosine(37)-N6)-methyltransferase TrmO [Desulfomonilaceae bacterium]|nr:tRNA (N6-threonylcarbamoyladenosine(37)-N6)-methyltransferase TrmO [Desulfomonilaceae bacterium]
MNRFCSVLSVILALAVSSKSMAEVYSVQPIGKVSKSFGKNSLEIFPRFRDGLLGLDKFSHVLVFYWFDRNDSAEKRATLRVHPRGDKANPLSGVFATRSPFRPNLIGLTVCKIRSVDESGIVVEDIDAFDGSPIIDLKPYMPAYDSVPEASVPEWVKKLHAK